MKKFFGTILGITKGIIRSLLIIFFVLSSAYGLVLTTSWILDLTSHDEGSKICQEVITKYLQAPMNSFKSEWVQKKGPYILQTKEFQRLFAIVEEAKRKQLVAGANTTIDKTEIKNGKKIKIKVANKNLKYLALQEELDARVHKAVFSLLKQNQKQTLWNLFFKGMIINLISFIALIFLLSEDSGLKDYDFDSDFDDLDAIDMCIIFFPVVIYLVFMPISTKFLTQSDIMATGAFMIGLIASVIFAVMRLNLTGVLASYLYQILNKVRGWIKEIISLAAFYWVRNNVEEDIFNNEFLSGLRQKNDFFVVDATGTSIVRVKKSLKSGTPVFSSESRKHMSLNDFFSYISFGAKNKAFLDIRKKFMRKFDEYFSEKGKKLTENYAGRLITNIKKDVKKKLVREKLIGAGNHDSVSEKMMIDLTNKSLKNFRKDFLELSQAKMSELMDKLHKSMLDQVLSYESTAHLEDESFNLVSLPKNTKFYLKQGKATIFVIEQAPQMRTIYFEGTKYHLAFPFTILIPVFVYEEYVGFYFFFANKPLNSLADKVFLSPLHNVSEDGEVCMGGGSAEMGLCNGISEKANRAVSGFWQASFNTDISAKHNEYARTFKEFASYEEWEKNSAKNPAFPLALNFLYGKNLREIIDVIIEKKCKDDGGRELMSDKVDKWFAGNQSIFREQILKMWSELNLKPYSRDEVRSYRQKREEEMDMIFERIQQICLENMDNDKVKKDFLTSIIESLQKVAAEDIDEIKAGLKLRCQVSFPELLDNVLWGKNKD
jgi:hypothetical protein